MTRACETAERPREARVLMGRNSFAYFAVSDCMFTSLRLSPYRPHFAARSLLNIYPVERARRWTVEHVASFHIERAFVTWTFKAPVLFLVIDGTGEMCAFLTISVILRLRDADENRCVLLSWIAEIKSRTDGHLRRIRDRRGREGWLATRIE